MTEKHGNLSIDSDNLFPIIKKWLYSDHDIFYRELISNGCDAITKLKKLDMMGEYSLPADYKGKIQVLVNPDEKTIKIIDNGLGMTADEVEEYISRIAFSGATDFIEKYKDKSNDDQIIGHFGLGFYSAFMVADEVTIDTLSYKEGSTPVHWSCDGGTEYNMEDGDMDDVGTEITLYLNDDCLEFANEYRAREVIEKYCSFMPTEIYLAKENAPEEYETIDKADKRDTDTVIEEIKAIQKNARENGVTERPKWPMIIFRSPKGWTGPKVVDGKQIEGTFRAHQVPMTMEAPEHLKMLEDWLKSYHPEKLFTEEGRLIPELEELAPTGDRRMGANPHANGGLLLRDLRLPDFRKYGIDVPAPGAVEAQDMIELGGFVRDIFKLNEESRNFRIFGPDETMSNRLGKVFEATNRDWNADKLDNDEFLAADGRVMDSMLSEHMCEGWLEGYLLTGRHGFFASYEAFIRIVDSMFSQHAKWLKVTSQLPWRQKIASLNYILSSNVWQQDHNGFTHQDPGFLDHIANKKADVVRMYLPPDANCLLSCFDHCIKSKKDTAFSVTAVLRCGAVHRYEGQICAYQGNYQRLQGDNRGQA